VLKVLYTALIGCLARSLAPSLSSLPLSLGVIEGTLGMTLFNIGLIYGFTSLGDQSGLLLPSAFLETPTVNVVGLFFNFLCGEGT